MNEIGKFLVVAGILICCAGLLAIFMPKIFLNWKIPGDIFIKRDNFTFSFPLGTCLIISILLSLLLNLFRK